MNFTIPAISSAQLRPKGLRILARPEQPPHEVSVLWRPHHQEDEGKASNFVVYGRVIKVGPGTLEPVWVHGDARLVERKPLVSPGDRIVWRHGYGPSAELVDGTHFWLHEDGVQGVWSSKEHEHAWWVDRSTRVFGCDCCLTQEDLETRLPSCGDKTDGPRVGWLEPKDWTCSDPLPEANLRPMGRRVSVLPELPPMRDAAIWTPNGGAKEGPGLGFVFYARVVRVGVGSMEACFVTDPATGKRVRDGKQRGAPTVKFRVKTPNGDQVRLRAVSTRQAWVPTTTLPGERVVLAQGWDDVSGHWLEEGIVANWTPAHACCVHVDGPKDFRCCTCGEACAWPGDPETPLVAEAIIGRDPTRLEPFGEPEPDPETEAPIMARMED